VTGGSLGADIEAAGFGLDKRAAASMPAEADSFGLEKRRVRDYDEDGLSDNSDVGFGLEKKKRSLSRFRSAPDEVGFGLDKRSLPPPGDSEAGFGLDKRSIAVDSANGFGLEKRQHDDGDAVYVEKRNPKFRLVIIPLDNDDHRLPTVRRRRRVRSVDIDSQVNPVSPHFGLE